VITSKSSPARARIEYGTIDHHDHASRARRNVLPDNITGTSPDTSVAQCPRVKRLPSQIEPGSTPQPCAMYSITAERT
jgi:hypothetical protein